MMTRILAGILVVCLSLCAWQTFKLERQADLLVSTQHVLDRRTEALEKTTQTLALKSEVGKIKEEVSVLLAQSTFVIQNNAQVNINNIRDLKGSIDNESKVTGKDGNALHPSVTRFLQQYEAERVHTN